ncbi:MAG: glycosyltransferase family 2 protein [Candidatus Hydrogenedentota bacterium]
MTALGWVVFIPALMTALLMAWNVIQWPRIEPAPTAAAPPERVSVLIPARNEAERVGPCIMSALAQGDAVAEVLVYDDHSTDGTAEAACSAAEGDTRLRVVSPQPLPEDWAGKPFACHTLGGEAKADWLLFLDADARLAAGGLNAMLMEARRRDVTLLAPWPGIEQHGAWEQLLMPLLNFCVFTMFPAPLALRRRDASMGLAHGACILAKTEAYHRIGGHETVRGALFEDTRLARQWRAQGERSACLDGSRVVQVRMYDTLGGIWRGFAKNVHSGFERQSSFWLFMAAHAALGMAPFVIAPWRLLIGVSAGGWLAAALSVLAARALLTWRFAYAWWPVLLHPVAEAMLIARGIAAWGLWVTGRGPEWKGRHYPSARGAAASTKERQGL